MKVKILKNPKTSISPKILISYYYEHEPNRKQVRYLVADLANPFGQPLKYEHLKEQLVHEFKIIFNQAKEWEIETLEIEIFYDYHNEIINNFYNSIGIILTTYQVS